MQARIFVTDGKKTVKLFWLEHDGKDVHCGLSRFSSKLTYHGSGEVHTTQERQNINKDWRTPLLYIKGLMHLTTIQSIPLLLSSSKPVLIPAKKHDAVFLIDLRTIHDHVSLHVAVGLLEKGRFDAIAPMLLPYSHNNIKLTADQVYLITSVNPWVWVILYSFIQEDQ